MRQLREIDGVPPHTDRLPIKDPYLSAKNKTEPNRTTVSIPNSSQASTDKKFLFEIKTIKSYEFLQNNWSFIQQKNFSEFFISYVKLENFTGFNFQTSLDLTKAIEFRSTVNQNFTFNKGKFIKVVYWIQHLLFDSNIIIFDQFEFTSDYHT